MWDCGLRGSRWMIAWVSCWILPAGLLPGDEPDVRKRPGPSANVSPIAAATGKSEPDNASIETAIQFISEAGANAQGAVAARKARELLAHADAKTLPRLLEAMDTPNVLAANWYRTAFDAIADRELAKPSPELPRESLEAYLRDARRPGRPRRLALALLERMDNDLRRRLLETWLDDPEFRRDAVEDRLKRGDQAKQAGNNDSAAKLYHDGFEHARDSDQVLDAVDKLKAVGRDVDPVMHLGFVNRWWLLGPFAAPDTTGFARRFPPEDDLQKAFDSAATYEGLDGGAIGWKLFQSGDRLGETNLNQALVAVKEAVGYAYAELLSPREQSVRLCCSADDNLTVWLNGEKVLAREQWLNGTRLDRFIVPVKLNTGRNRVLVKICQGPQHVNPEVPNNWTFQLRICDQTGRAADFQNALPLPK